MRPRGLGVAVFLAVGLMLAAVSPARGLVWSVQPTPFSGVVSGVSCVSVRFCTAVGGVDESSGPTAGTAAMGWEGRRWRIQPTPDPDPANEDLRAHDGLAGVSCTSSKACVAVGEYNPSSFSPDGIHTVLVSMPLAERWNGVRWSLLPFPSLPSGAQAGALSAVSCTARRVCMAVGGYVAFFPPFLFAERWDGTSWLAESMPEPVGATSSSVAGLSCTSDTFCIAVGSYVGALPGYQPFAERWDGSTWSLVPLARVAGPVDTELMSVSCTSPRACIAVGQYSTFPHQGTYQAFAQRWDGTRWSLQRTPIALHQSTALSSVSCTSSRACTAVGGIDFQPLVERWDGTSWSLQRTHNASSPTLQAVSCTSRAICTAVGNPARGNAVAEQSAPAARR